MIKYINRRGSDCYKWDSECVKGALPLWVADMDFEAAPAILKALHHRLEHGVFGYAYVPEAYYEAVVNWFARRHEWTNIRKECLIPSIGVVPAVAAILRAMTKPGDKVLMHTPAYNCFFRCLTNAECELVESPLKYVDHHYEIDWEDFEKKIKGVKAMILCNPHNPTGRVWTHEELQRMAQICAKEDVFVIADEIHCEFAFPGYTYTPYATVAENDRYCICTSPSKAFNIAGLQCANIYCPDAKAETLIRQALDKNETGNLNAFAVYTLMAAYNESEEWIDELMELVYGNWCFVREYIEQNNLPLVDTKMEGTYLAWVKLPDGMKSAELCQKLQEKENILFNPSTMYGVEGFVRINLATSRENVMAAMKGLGKMF